MTTVLTSEQLQFLDHDPRKSGRLLAGPGTGKSFTSVAYIEHLAERHPELKVRMITFTRAATAEFAEKLGDKDLLSLNTSRPATVHGFALSILMKHRGQGLPQPLRIPDSWETKELIRPHLSSILRRRGYTSATPGVVEDLEQEMAAGWQSLDPTRELLSEIDPNLRAAYVGAWRAHRSSFGYVLLGELPYRAGDVIEDVGSESADVDLLIVDEFQDLNRADIRLLKLLAERGAAVLAIGDDDQSIYSWRMAAPDGIRNFLTEFGATQDYHLSQSRRCGNPALAAANTLIQTEPDRPAKHPLEPTPDAPETKYLHLRFKSGHTEATGVAAIIADRIGAGVQPNKIAVLVRSSLAVWASHLRPELEKVGVPIGAAGGVSAALADPELRRGIALAHLALNEYDSLAWWSLLKVTPGVGGRFIDYVNGYEANGSFAHKLRAAVQAGCPGGPRTASKAQDMVVATLAAVQGIDLNSVELGELGWGGWLLKHLNAERLQAESRELMEKVGAAIPDGEPLDKFLAELEPLGKELLAGSNEGIRLMTIAQSKGLTFDTTIIMGVEDGIIPAPRGDEREEIRLLYVALTRAAQMTFLTWANYRVGPTARRGTPLVAQKRARSPLLSGLTIGAYEDGDRYVANLDLNPATK